MSSSRVLLAMHGAEMEHPDEAPPRRGCTTAQHWGQHRRTGGTTAPGQGAHAATGAPSLPRRRRPLEQHHLAASGRPPRRRGRAATPRDDRARSCLAAALEGAGKWLLGMTARKNLRARRCEHARGERKDREKNWVVSLGPTGMDSGREDLGSPQIWGW